MYALFSQPSRHYGGQIEANRFIDVQKRIYEDVERVVQYYRYGAFAVKTNHLLVRLINAMNTPLSYELDRYYESATSRALFTANTFEFTTAINQGKWHEGHFYHDCKELIIAYTGNDDPSELDKNWKDLKAVHVLETPVSNLKYMVPNGISHNVERGQAVIGIDLAKLMIQYRGFVMDQRARTLQGLEGNLSNAHFVAKYVLPNMLYSQTDLVITNRLINLFDGAPMGDSVKSLPFHISDYSALLDRSLNEVLKRIKDARLEYQNILKQIPVIFNDFPLQMPDIAETRQVWWALFITRFKVIEFLWNLGDKTRHFNQTHINKLLIDLKRFKSDNVFSTRLTPELLSNVNYFMRHALDLH